MRFGVSGGGQWAGGSALTLDVFGANFINGSTIKWNGTVRATTFVDAGHLQTALPQALVSQPGLSSVTVTTPGPGGGTSNPLTLTIRRLFQIFMPAVRR